MALFFVAILTNSITILLHRNGALLNHSICQGTEFEESEVDLPSILSENREGVYTAHQFILPSWGEIEVNKHTKR